MTGAFICCIQARLESLHPFRIAQLEFEQILPHARILKQLLIVVFDPVVSLARKSEHLALIAKHHYFDQEFGLIVKGFFIFVLDIRKRTKEELEAVILLHVVIVFDFIVNFLWFQKVLHLEWLTGGMSGIVLDKVILVILE